ncbi:MAG: hypothetical protein EYC68_17395 [Chloroflexota bacterium]|nr:MAG: hypothetical protein EYC68_17395 [Chloroflexota bacterium]
MNLNHKFYQWGGIAFMLGNVLFVVNKIDEMSRHFFGRPMPDVISGDDILLILIGQIGLIIGYVAFYKFYTPRVGRQAKIALTLFCVGGIILAIGHVAFMSAQTDFMFVFVFIGLLILLIGLIWFGVLNLRQPMMNGWRWLPLATGLMGLIGFFFFSGAEITANFLAFRTLFALGLIGLGFTLWSEKSVQTEFAQ